MNSLVDIYILTKLIRTLVTDWKDQPAYKYGLIDDKGNRTKKPLNSSQEKGAYNIFWKFAFNLKRMIESFPGGKSKLAKFITAYALFKEESADQAFGYFLDAGRRAVVESITEDRLVTGIEYILLHETMDDNGNLLEPGDSVQCMYPIAETTFFGNNLFEVVSKKTRGRLLVGHDDIQAIERRHLRTTDS